MSKHPYIVAEMMRHQWAMTQEAAEGLVLAVEDHLTSEDRDKFHAVSEEQYEAVSAQLGLLVEDTKLSRIKGSVGSLFISGPILPRADTFLESSGIVSIGRLMSEFKALEANDMVKEILLVFDSPGGAVTGVDEFAALIAGCDKRTTAYVLGSAASAAYWLASAADSIVGAPTSIEGSIGVVLTVRVSKNTNRVELVSEQSPFKRVDAATSKGKEQLRRIPTGLATVFIETVAKNRGVSAEKVMADFGKGASLVAKEALAAGMIDKIDTLENTMTGFSLVEGLDCGEVEALGPFLGANGDEYPDYLTIKIVDTKELDNINMADNRPQTTEEKHMPTLQELVAEHRLQHELDATIQAAREEGVAAAKSEQTQIMKEVKKVLDSKAYKGLHGFALEVIFGDRKLAALEGAVAAFDVLNGKDEEDAAIADSKGEAEVVVKPVAPVATDSALLNSTAALNAEICELRGDV